MGWDGKGGWAGGRLSMGRCLFWRMWAVGGGGCRCVVGGEGMGALKEHRVLVTGRCNYAGALLWSFNNLHHGCRLFASMYVCMVV